MNIISWSITEKQRVTNTSDLSDALRWLSNVMSHIVTVYFCHLCFDWPPITMFVYVSPFHDFCISLGCSLNATLDWEKFKFFQYILSMIWNKRRQHLKLMTLSNWTDLTNVEYQHQYIFCFYDFCWAMSPCDKVSLHSIGPSPPIVLYHSATSNGIPADCRILFQWRNRSKKSEPITPLIQDMHVALYLICRPNLKQMT